MCPNAEEKCSRSCTEDYWHSFGQKQGGTLEQRRSQDMLLQPRCVTNTVENGTLEPTPRQSCLTIIGKEKKHSGEWKEWRKGNCQPWRTEVVGGSFGWFWLPWCEMSQTLVKAVPEAIRRRPTLQQQRKKAYRSDLHQLQKDHQLMIGRCGQVRR